MSIRSGADLVAQARGSVATCTAAEAADRLARGALLLDVREPEEHARGTIPGATPVPRGVLEFKIGELCPESDRPILIHCAGGGRAVLAAKTLSEMGYRDVAAVTAAFEDLAAACR